MKYSLRELNKIRCRRRILKASRRLFTARGFEQTTMDEVAAAAEVSKATLYNYFSSKQSLLIGIADGALDEVRQLIRDESGEDRVRDSLTTLRHVLQMLVLDSIRYLSISRRILYLGASAGNELYPACQSTRDLFRQLIAAARDEGRLRLDLPLEGQTDLFMGLYLMTQFAWDDLPQCGEAQCTERVDAAFDQLLEQMTP